MNKNKIDILRLRSLRRPSARVSLAGILLVTGVMVLSASVNPVLVCDDPEFSFPPTDNAQTIEHSFTLRNDGMAPLLIHRVYPDCGCLLVRTPPATIEPGDTLELHVKFDLKGRRGVQRRRITVSSNDPARPQLTLIMVGEALAAAGVYPEELFWGNIRSDLAEQREVLVEFAGAGTATVTGVDSGIVGFEVDVEAVDIGKTYRLILRTCPPIAFGRFASVVSIQTDHPRFPVLKLPMSGRVVTPVFTIPDEIVLDASCVRPTTVLLLVRAAAVEEKFQLRRVIAPELPSLAASATADTANDTNTVRFKTIHNGMRLEWREVRALPELDGQTLLIETDHPDMPEIHVPIRITNTSENNL